MGVLRSPQHQLVPLQQVEEARVTLDHRGGKSDDLVQNFVEWGFRGHSTGDAVQKNHVRAMPFYVMGRISTSQQYRPTEERLSARSIHAGHVSQSAFETQLSFGIESHEKNRFNRSGMD
jgi:hypothetical protein